MKRLTILVLLLLCVQVLNVGAYEITVDSASQEKIVLVVSDLKTVDIKVEDATATVETQSISDTYAVDARASTQGDKVLISIDVSPIFEDYSVEEVKEITVSGKINVAGESIEFGKRVPYRSNSPTQSSQQRAPSLPSTSSSVIYWIVGLSLVLVLLILILFYNKPKRSRAKRKRVIKRKKPVVKIVKKRSIRKKAKKRL